MVRCEQLDAVTITMDDPIICASREVQQQTLAARGVMLPTRRDINARRALLPEHCYMMGVHALCMLHHGDDKVIPLLQRSQSAPSNPGRWSGFGGVCHQHPLATLAEEVVEECGLIGVKESGNMQALLCLLPESHYGLTHLEPSLLQHKQSQLAALARNCPAQHFALEQQRYCLHTDTMPRVSIITGDKSYSLPALLSVDHVHQSCTLGMMIHLDITDYDDCLMFDPEPMARTVGLYSLEDAMQLDCTLAAAAALEFLNTN